MTEVILIHLNDLDQYSDETPRVALYMSESAALTYLNEVATVERPAVRIQDVFKFNADHGTIKKMEAKLTGFKLTLVEKQADGQR